MDLGPATFGAVGSRSIQYEKNNDESGDMNTDTSMGLKPAQPSRVKSTRSALKTLPADAFKPTAY